MSLRLLEGDCRVLVPTLESGSVQCVVTSPPYWGLRDYGVEGQLGLEATPQEYLARMVAVFREVRRVLRVDGTLWLNMGDSYAGGGPHHGELNLGKSGTNRGSATGVDRPAVNGCKPKDLVGMPWRLAFALQADGWFLRSDIVWAKPNPMPESVTDRPTKAHEYVFLLTKSARYYYDGEAIREPATYGFSACEGMWDRVGDLTRDPMRVNGARGAVHKGDGSTGRQARSVWTIPSAPYPDAHFATFPPELARRCIVAGTSAKGCCAECGAPWVRNVVHEPVGDRTAVVPTYERHGVLNRRMHPGSHPTAPKEQRGWSPTCAHNAGTVPCTVLDLFGGSGTVGEVAEQNGRDAVLIELSPTYCDLIHARTAQRGLFATRDIASPQGIR
jgi:DNA modification methylase